MVKFLYQKPIIFRFFSRSTFFWEMIDRKNKDVRTISTTIFFKTYVEETQTTAEVIAGIYKVTEDNM